MAGLHTKLPFNLVCWLLGHDVGGKMVADSFRSASGRVGPGLQYYCKHCQGPDNFPIHQFPDGRNLYRRTTPPAIGESRAYSYLHN